MTRNRRVTISINNDIDFNSQNGFQCMQQGPCNKNYKLVATDIVTRLIQVVTMGFFSSDISPDEKEQQRIEKTLGEYNIFEGFECEVVFPEKQLKTTGSSGTKKGLATLAFGVIGWAATSGTSQNEENRIVTTIFQVVDKGIVFKNGSIDGSDIRIPYNEIIKMEVIEPEKGDIIGMLTLLKNKRIIINPKMKINKNKREFNWEYKKNIILNHTSDIINERACGAQYEEAGWGLEHATAEPQETKQESGSLMDELERLGNMYEKGLLTDDEFAAMKKKLIEGG